MERAAPFTQEFLSMLVSPAVGGYRRLGGVQHSMIDGFLERIDQ